MSGSLEPDDPVQPTERDRLADKSKEPCGMDPESPAAIRNGKFATIAQVAAQGLGMDGDDA